MRPKFEVPAGSSGSSYDQQYKLLSPPGNLISLQFQIKIFIYQTSRPRTHSRAVNYDLQAGADVTMDSLFLPGSDYLMRISNYCIAQLKTRPIDFEIVSQRRPTQPGELWELEYHPGRFADHLC